MLHDNLTLACCLDMVLYLPLGSQLRLLPPSALLILNLNMYLWVVIGLEIEYIMVSHLALIWGSLDIHEIWLSFPALSVSPSVTALWNSFSWLYCFRPQNSWPQSHTHTVWVPESRALPHTHSMGPESRALPHTQRMGPPVSRAFTGHLITCMRKLSCGMITSLMPIPAHQINGR